MELNRNLFKKILQIVALAALLLALVLNLSHVVQAVQSVLRILSPFLIGLITAFILNIPMRFLERKLFPKRQQYGRRTQAATRALCMVLTLLIVFGIICAVLFLVLPKLAESIGLLIENLPKYFDDLKASLLPHLQDSPKIAAWVEGLHFDWEKILNSVVDFLVGGFNSDTISTTVNAATSVVFGISNFFIGIVFSIYFLAKKETLCRQTKKVLFAFVPQRRANQLLSVCRLAFRTFSSFLSGQCLEACILGILIFLSMTIFGFPYASMIGVLTAVTALIPIFGAIIGCVVGAFFILLLDPMQAVWFVVMFIVVQQIEGNLIYPFVVGNSVGLPALWVLVAVIIGGSLMGILGMIFFIPLVSVCYTLFRRVINNRLKKRGHPEEQAAQQEPPAADPPKPQAPQ